MSRKSVDPIFLGLIFFLFGYVFFADILISIFGLAFIKGLCALGTLAFAGAYCAVHFSRLRLKKYLFVPIIIILIYVFVFHSTYSLSYFYTAIFAFLLVQDENRAKKYLEIVFVIQFVFVLYEVLTQNLIYTEVTTGLFNARELEQKVELFDESGFRAKGLFTGCLEATAFAINFSLIFRDERKKSFFAFLMTVLLNGRMAMIITFIIFVYNLIILARERHVSKRTIRVVFIGLALVMSSVLVTLAATSQRIYHLLSAFSPESDSFLGRTESYALAFNEYFKVYTIGEKLVGSEYELVRLIDGRQMAAESDILGMLLEIGLIGFLYILYNMIKAFKSSKEKLFEPSHISLKLTILLLFVCMIEYRHGAGNIRGTTLWFIILSSQLSTENKPALSKKKHVYENAVPC